MTAAKDDSWFSDVLSSLPDDEVQVNMLGTLAKNGPGQVMVGDLTSLPGVDEKAGVKILHKMLRNGQVKVENDGRVFITGFGRRSIGVK